MTHDYPACAQAPYVGQAAELRGRLVEVHAFETVEVLGALCVSKRLRVQPLIVGGASRACGAFI